MNSFHALRCLISIALLVVYATNAHEIKRDTQQENVSKNSNTNAYLNLKKGCYLLSEFNDSLLNMRSYSDAWESIDHSNYTPSGVIIDSIVNETIHMVFIYSFHEGLNVTIDNTGTIISGPISDKGPRHLKIDIYQGNTISIKQVEVDDAPIVNGIYTLIGGNFENYFISVLFDSIYKDSLNQRYSIKDDIVTFPNGAKYKGVFGSDLVGDEDYFTGGLRMSPVLKTDSCTYYLYKKNVACTLYSTCDSNCTLILRPIR